ncbi:MAG: hypothetical protein K0R76_620 [Alphaproteobacteria bacterium]|jgi:hypothetical protein|nr:hypothetical protein [Alphaproteobacteria bacterium]
MKTKMKILASSAIIMTTFGLSSVSWSQDRDLRYTLGEAVSAVGRMLHERPCEAPIVRATRSPNIEDTRQNYEITPQNGNGGNGRVMTAEDVRQVRALYRQGQNDNNSNIHDLISLCANDPTIECMSVNASAGRYKEQTTWNRRIQDNQTHRSGNNQYSGNSHIDRSTTNSHRSGGGGGLSLLGLTIGGGGSSSGNNTQTDIHNNSTSNSSNHNDRTRNYIDTSTESFQPEFVEPTLSFEIKRSANPTQQRFLSQESTQPKTQSNRIRRVKSSNLHTFDHVSQIVETQSDKRAFVPFSGTGHKLRRDTVAQAEFRADEESPEMQAAMFTSLQGNRTAFSRVGYGFEENAEIQAELRLGNKGDDDSPEMQAAMFLSMQGSSISTRDINKL